MNDSIVSYYQQAHKLIADSFDRPTIDEDNERLYVEEELRTYPLGSVRECHGAGHLASKITPTSIGVSGDIACVGRRVRLLSLFDRRKKTRPSNRRSDD